MAKKEHRPHSFDDWRITLQKALEFNRLQCITLILQQTGIKTKGVEVLDVFSGSGWTDELQQTLELGNIYHIDSDPLHFWEYRMGGGYEQAFMVADFDNLTAPNIKDFVHDTTIGGMLVLLPLKDDLATMNHVFDIATALLPPGGFVYLELDESGIRPAQSAILEHGFTTIYSQDRHLVVKK